MLAMKTARVPAIAVILLAVTLALVAAVPSVTHPHTASAQGVPPYCAAGYTSNGISCTYAGAGYCPYAGYPGCATGYGTCLSGTAGCINGVCQAGYAPNAAGGCTLSSTVYGGACTIGTIGCVNGLCTGGYAANGLGGCTLSSGATSCIVGGVGCINGFCTAGSMANGAGGCTIPGTTGACTVGSAGCINGVCTTGYAANNVGGCTLLNTSTTCVAGTVGCVNGVCTTPYASNGASGCTLTGAASTCVNGTAGCVNGVCTSGYVSNGASGCTLNNATACPAGTSWNGSSCAGIGAALSSTPVQTPLNTGCNLVVVAFGAGATPQQVVTATANPAAVLSVWGWDNTRQRWMGYFPGQASAASDLQTLPARTAVFVCVNAATTLTAP